jgi:hypothetical protein
MRAVSGRHWRTATAAEGDDAAGSVFGGRRCRIGTDSHGTRRTPTKPVKSRLLCQLQRSAFEFDCDPPYMNQGVTGGVSCVVSFV